MTTNNKSIHNKLTLFRNHGIIRDPQKFKLDDLAFDKNGNFFPDFFEKYKENVQIGEKVIFVSQNGDISSILANGFVEQLNQTNIYHLKDGVSGLDEINFDFE